LWFWAFRASIRREIREWTEAFTEDGGWTREELHEYIRQGRWA